MEGAGDIINIMPNFFSRLLQKNKSADSTAGKSDAPLGVGSLINDRYRLEAEIGRGGMGIVYRAHDIPNYCEVAIKVINAERANALTRQQFLQEAEISSRFHHPHIVEVDETGVTETQTPTPYIVMELVQGMSLIDMQNLTYARILDIGKQICDALAYAHEQGYVYRDLKPANVLIEKRGFQYFAKLMDFGLARPRGMANLPNESHVAGTLFYLAPELIAGQPADIPSDLYALGATLYEMITGRVPFSDYDEETILAQHLEESVAPPSHSQHDIPPALEAIILRLLEKNPKDRFASAQEVHAALEQVRLASERIPVKGNLPQLAKEFTGHESEVIQVKQLLESNALVTILGDGETLALASATLLDDHFSDGIWWVDFKLLEDPRLVLESVTSALGVNTDPNRSLTVLLVEYLREKNLLLLLIHCDRLLGACAQLAETILRNCPDVYILATSQQALKVPGEKCWTPSALPAAGASP